MFFSLRYRYICLCLARTTKFRKKIMDKITYETTGVCSSLIEVEIENNIIKRVVFTGGCNGNLKGISSLVVGLDVNEVIKCLGGITCGYKETSCPDQLANCLMEYLKKQAAGEIVSSK